MKKKAAIYCRVSTLDQKTELQMEEATQFVAARGWEIAFTFEDKQTGTNTKRQGYQEMMALARKRKFEILVVWKLDRLGRSLKDLVLTLQEFSELGIEFVSMKDQIDTSTSAGKLMLHMLGAFAEFEGNMIRERVNAGLRAAKAKGKRLGRPAASIDSEKIIALHASGKSYRAIQGETGYSMGAIGRVLTVHQKPLQMGAQNPL